MGEPAAKPTILLYAQAAKLPPAGPTGLSPAAGEVPTATPALSSAPKTAPAAVPPTSVSSTAPLPRAAEPQRPPAAPRVPIAQPAATSPPSTTAPPATTPAPSATAQAAVAGHQQSSGLKKRRLEKWELQNSTYFKIRAIVRDLRPAFLQVRLAPDFRNCKAADEIRRQLKVLSDLSKQLSIEGVSSGKKTIEGQSFVEDRKEAMDIRVKVEKQVGTDGAPAGVPNQPGMAPSVPEEMIPEVKGTEKQLRRHQGTYVVGGSPMGWNFLVYRGSQPVYCGVTKEAYRSRRSSC